MKIYSSVIIDQLNPHSHSLHPLNLSFRIFAPNACLRILSRLYNDIFRHFRKHCEECLCHGLASPHVDQDGSRKA